MQNENAQKEEKKKEDPTNFKTMEKKHISNKKENLEKNDKKNLNDEIMVNNDKIKDYMELKEEKELKNLHINNSGLYKKEDILDIFSNEKLKKFKNLIEKNDINKNVLKSMTSKKTRRKRKIEHDNENYKITELKRGRIKKEDNKKGYHNKFSADNIIRKNKQNLMKYIVLSTYPYFGHKLNRLNYKELVSKSGKKFNLELLDMKLKELLSQKISGKCLTKPAYINKNYINQILEENNNETIKYILNITFRDWIDIFTMKRESTFNNVKFDGIDLLLEDILKNKDDKGNIDGNYFCNFVYCLYNYEKFWECKRERKMNKNE